MTDTPQHNNPPPLNMEHSQKRLDVFMDGEEEMVAFGKNLASVCAPGNIYYLHGELGAGKTTLSRGFLRGFGHEGAVKSPTYTIVEHYQLKNQRIYHFDLYRLTDPEELEYMGARDYFHQHAICLVEWAENGAGFLPKADLDIKITYESAGRRRVHLAPGTHEGYRIIHDLDQYLGLYSASSKS